MTRKTKRILIAIGCVTVVCIGSVAGLAVWLAMNAPETNPAILIDLQVDENGKATLPNGMTLVPEPFDPATAIQKDNADTETLKREKAEDNKRMEEGR